MIEVLQQKHAASGRTAGRMLLLFILSAFLLTGLPLRAPLAARGALSDGGAQQPGASFRIAIDYVHVDATVTDQEGRFVRDLGPEDFELYEDGRRQHVSTFALVDVPIDTRSPGGSLSPARVEPDVRSNGAESGGRVYVVVLDDLHVAALRSARVKEVARQFIEGHLGPNDLSAVLYTSGRAEASQEFTNSAGLLLQAVDKFVGRKLRSSVLERLDEYERRRHEPTRADMRMDRVTDPLDAQRGDQARRMLETLRSLADLLSRAQGRRKAVVLISEGVDYDLQQGVAQTSSGLTSFTSSHAPDVLRELQETIRAAARANINIYSIDPRGLAGTGDEVIEVGSFPENPFLGLTPTSFQDELRQAQDSLRLLSEETGGVASVSSNDFTAAFDRVVRDNSTYYMIGYQSNNDRGGGRFRKIEVRVKRPGVRVRARSGYAVGPSKKPGPGLLTPAVEPSAALREALNAPLPVLSLPLRIYAAPFRGAKDASVSVGLEIDARTFRFERDGGFFVDTLQVAVVALDDQGKFKAGDRQTIKLRLRPDTHRAVRAQGLRVLFRLSLPPGRFQLRAAAHESGAEATGSVYYDLDVPDFKGMPLAMSGLVLAATRAAGIPTVRPDPSFEGVLPSPPTGVRSFHPDETLMALFEIYEGAQARRGVVDLVTSVRGADEEARFRSEEPVSEEKLRAGGGGLRYAVRIPLADFTPGPYTLQVEARARVSPNHVAVREVPFQIVPSGTVAK